MTTHRTLYSQRPVHTFMMQYDIKPSAIPSVIEKVKGIITGKLINQKPPTPRANITPARRGRERLSDWHHALEKLGLPFATSAPINWLETGHD